MIQQPSAGPSQQGPPHVPLQYGPRRRSYWLTQDHIVANRYEPIVKKQGQKILCEVFKHKYLGGQQNVKDFFLTLGNNNTDFRRKFNRQMRNQLDSDSPEQYDIPLLFLLLRTVCGLSEDRNVWIGEGPSMLENLIEQVKHERNRIAFGDTYYLTYQDLVSRLDNFNKCLVTMLTQPFSNIPSERAKDLQEEIEVTFKEYQFIDLEDVGDVLRWEGWENDIVQNLPHSITSLELYGAEETLWAFAGRLPHLTQLQYLRIDLAQLRPHEIMDFKYVGQEFHLKPWYIPSPDIMDHSQATTEHRQFCDVVEKLSAHRGPHLSTTLDMDHCTDATVLRIVQISKGRGWIVKPRREELKEFEISFPADLQPQSSLATGGGRTSPPPAYVDLDYMPSTSTLRILRW